MKLSDLFRFSKSKRSQDPSDSDRELSLDELVRGRVKISECLARAEVTVAGTVIDVSSGQNDDSPWFQAVIEDESQRRLTLIWLGRDSVPGIVGGVTLRARGTVQSKSGSLSIIEPSYTILNRKHS